MTSDSVGDVWEYSLALSAGFSRLGVEVNLAVIGPRLSEERRHRARAIPNLRLFEGPSPTPGDSAIWSDLGVSGEWLLDLERSIQPHLVHANALLHATVLWRSPYVVVAHRCMICWWLAVAVQDRPRHWGIYQKRVTRGLHDASLIVAPTSAAVSELYEQYGPAVAARVIPYGHSYQAVADLKKEFIITAADSWDEANNLEMLELTAPYVSWPMFMAGRSVDVGGKPRPPRNICALGSLSDADLDSWLARSSIYVMPARYLTCPMTVLRAAAAGCALVLGAIPSLKETWEGAAVFVPSGDREAIRTAIERLVFDSSRRRELQASARTRAAALTGSAMVSAYAAAYRDALSAAAQRSYLSESLVGA